MFKWLFLIYSKLKKSRLKVRENTDWSMANKYIFKVGLFSEAMLHFIKYIQFSEVFSPARSDNMLQNFVQDTSQ